MRLAAFIYWFSIGVVVYIYAGYPLLIAILARIRKNIVHKDGSATPKITILVVAYNEEKVIGRKIENILSLEYPSEKRKVIVASDASTDGTDAIVRSFWDRGVVLRTMGEKMGKSAVLNRVVPEIEDRIVVFSDARQIWNSGALQALVSNFSDQDIGAVSGELILRPKGESGIEQGIGMYWKYEKFIRKNESKFHSTCGVTGCIYALDRSLFRPIPDDTLLDDLVIPMIALKEGKRIILEEGAVAFDFISETVSHEISRKVRTLAGNFQACFRMPWLFNPLENKIWLQFLSHKFARLFVPHLFLIALISNVMLVGSSFYNMSLLIGILLILLSVFSLLFEVRFLGALKTFVILNYSAAIALPLFLMGRQDAAWKK